MFLERAKIGYVCWLCSKDTLNFQSDTDMELCEECDAKHKVDYKYQVAMKLHENELFIRDAEVDLIPRVDLKIKILNFKSLLGFINWLNTNAGKTGWRMTANPVKEMANNHGRTTSHFHLFVPYKDISKEYKTLWGDNIVLVGFSHMAKDGKDFRYKEDYAEFGEEPQVSISPLPVSPLAVQKLNIDELSGLPTEVQSLTVEEFDKLKEEMARKYGPRRQARKTRAKREDRESLKWELRDIEACPEFGNLSEEDLELARIEMIHKFGGREQGDISEEERLARGRRGQIYLRMNYLETLRQMSAFPIDSGPPITVIDWTQKPLCDFS